MSITPVPDAETKTAAEQCLRFLQLCAEGKLAPKLDPSDDVRSLAETHPGGYDGDRASPDLRPDRPSRQVKELQDARNRRQDGSSSK